MYEDLRACNLYKEQYGAFPRKWSTLVLELPQRVITIVFLDFREPFDLIDNTISIIRQLL